jgi:hypothetical protein
MPKIERYILLAHNGRNYEFKNCEGSDDRAIRKAIRELEKQEGLMAGGLKRYFKMNPDNIILELR